MNDRGPDPGIFIPNLVLLLLLSVGVLARREPLNSVRPASSPEHPTTMTGDEVKSRPWEDPLTVRRRGSLSTNWWDSEPGSQGDREEEKDAPDQKTLALVVLLPGGFEGDAVERRVRIRQAVMAGMARAQYLPQRPDSLALFAANSLPKLTNTVFESFTPESLAPRTNAFTVPALPLENMASSSTSLRALLQDQQREYDKIYVVYVDFNELTEAALNSRDGSGTSTVSAYWTNLMAQVCGRWTNCEIDVIGPPSSDALMEVLRFRSPWSADGREIDVFSPWASMADDELIHKMLPRLANREWELIGTDPGSAIAQRTNIFRDLVADGCPWLMAVKQPHRDTMKDADGDLTNRFVGYTLFECSGKILAFLPSLTNAPLPNCAKAPPRTHVERTILTDERLAEALVRELENRKVDLRDPSKTIVLISESDRIYGRSFPVTFQKKVLEHLGYWRKGEAPNLSVVGARRNLIDVQCYSYLRGLDGRTVLSRETGAAVQSARNRTEDSESVAGMLQRYFPKEASHEPDWRPQGTPQFDRVRSLARELRNRKPEGGSRGGRVVAVGVVGSDIYDKLVVLQALRPELPEAIFFTTDLDANLLTEENQRITRNVLVASTFGLTLNPIFQGATMPFRDTYQTAVFHSVLRSTDFYRKLGRWEAAFGAMLHDPSLSRSTNALLHALQWQPNLFEIGLNGAVPLLQQGAAEAIRRTSAKDSALPPNRLDPPPLRAWPLAGCVMFLTVLALAFFALVSPGTGVLGARFDSWPIIVFGLPAACLAFLPWLLPGRLGLTAATAAFVPVVVLLSTLSLMQLGSLRPAPIPLIFASLTGLGLLDCIVTKAHYTSGEEPFGILDGISSWPSEILRFIGLALAAYYCIAAARDVRMACERTSQFLAGRKATSKIVHFLQAGINTHAREKRGCAVLLGTLVLLIPPCSLFIAMGFPARPFRGSAIMWVDSFNLAANIFVLYLLATFAIGQSLFCMRRLIVPVERIAQALNNAAKRGVPPGFKLNADLMRYLLKAIAIYSNRLYRLPFYPCLVIFVLILSRHPALDNWPISTPIVLAVLYVITVLALVSWIVNYRARRLKARIQESFAAGKAATPDPSTGKTEIEAVRSGAFAPFISNPVFRAILVPIGGSGFLALLEWLNAYIF